MSEQTGVVIAWQKKLDGGEFVIQQCGGCKKHVFYPRELCNHCGSGDLSWVATPGEGTVYSTTTIHRAADAGGNYNVALIDLDEGVRLMSRVEGIASEQVKIGQRVKSRVQVQEGEPALLLFDAVGGA